MRDDQVDIALLNFAARFVNRSAEEQISFLTLAEKELGESRDEIKIIALELVRKLHRRAAAWRECERVRLGA